MSSKRKQLKTTKKSSTDDSMKESFSQRINDDLSEVILQFLPLKDKFRFECVSKQFQRTVFVKHYELDANSIRSLQSFESMIKKLPNIGSIDLRQTQLDSNRVIEMIVNNCHNLRDIYFSRVDQKLDKNFVQKFGSKLKGMEVMSKTIGKSFPNLEIIYGTTPSYVSGLQFNKLKKLSIDCSKGINGFKQFIKNHKSLTHISISGLKSQHLEDVFNSLSELKNLVHFDIDTEINVENESIITALELMSVRCPKVKSIGCRITYSTFSDYLNVFKDFKQLKRLNLKLEYDTDTEWYHFEEDPDMFSADLFNGLSNLTHLTLYCHFEDGYVRLKPNNFDHLEEYLPNLRYLEIQNNFETYDLLRYVLRGLSKLEVIKLTASDHTLISDLVKNCKKFKYFTELDEIDE